MNFGSLKRPDFFSVLYSNYVQARGISDISEDLLERIVLVYPGLLVTSSDGFVDLTEAHFLIQAAGIAIEKDVVAREFKFLYLNAGAWRPQFSKLITEYNKLNSISKDLIIIMIQAASVSTGSVVKNILMAGQKPDLSIQIDFNAQPQPLDPEKQFLSDQERQTIIEVAEKLGLITDNHISQYLRILLS